MQIIEFYRASDGEVVGHVSVQEDGTLDADETVKDFAESWVMLNGSSAGFVEHYDGWGDANGGLFEAPELRGRLLA